MGRLKITPQLIPKQTLPELTWYITRCLQSKYKHLDCVFYIGLVNLISEVLHHVVAMKLSKLLLSAMGEK